MDELPEDYEMQELLLWAELGFPGSRESPVEEAIDAAREATSYCGFLPLALILHLGISIWQWRVTHRRYVLQKKLKTAGYSFDVDRMLSTKNTRALPMFLKRYSKGDKLVHAIPTGYIETSYNRARIPR
jgi:hypothetical protein